MCITAKAKKDFYMNAYLDAFSPKKRLFSFLDRTAAFLKVKLFIPNSK